MARFITTRATSGYGPAAAASCISALAVAEPTYQLVSEPIVKRDVEDRHVILAAHGFNVSRKSGVRSLARLEQALPLRAGEVFFGVLGPGDWWLPVINYPAEADDAVDAGRKLAAYVNRVMAGAASLSLVSHSLGGRVVLEAIKHLDRKAHEVCVAAGAVDNDCLVKQYAAIKDNVRRISVLSSRKDKALKLAYPLGDFGSDVLFGDDDSAWRGALGLKGPNPKEALPKVEHRPIPKDPPYDHGDYFPPGGVAAPPAGQAWERSARYIRRCLDGAPDTW